MRLLDYHIGKTVFLAMLVVLGLMVAVDVIFSFADELGETGQNYTVANAAHHVLLTTPTTIYEMLPYAALGGALIGLGLLASHNELVVMRAAGVNTRRIVWSVMKPTLLIMAVSLVIGEWVAPQLEQRAQSNRAIIQSGGEAISTQRGDWRKIGDEFIHVNAIAPGGRELFGVTRYVFDGQQRLLRSSFAARGIYVDQGDTGHWLLSDMRESAFSGSAVDVTHHQQYRWQVSMSPELLSVLLVRPDRQSISGLWQFAQYFESEGLDSGSYFLAFWKKLFQPLATASLVLLAISFVFGPLREATMGYRVFVAIAIGLGFTILQRMLGPTTLLYGFSPLLGALVPVLLCAGLGAILLRRV